MGAAQTNNKADGALAANDRIRALDILRGLVIVVMALDHVRDFFHVNAFRFDPLDPAQTNVALYLTRWVTHFCAPVFVFLAGVSVYLQAAKGKDTATLSRFLLTRGAWLIFLEFTVIGFGWAFSVPFMLFLQVIWVIGASMIVLAALVWLPRVVVLIIGIAIVAGHNLLDPIASQNLGLWRVPWMLLHEQNVLFSDGKPVALIAYPLLAWTGVMALGYGMGAIFISSQRDRALALIGLAMIALFFLLRFLNGYGNPTQWVTVADAGTTVMRFFNVHKYPPSLMFICATLGPMLLIVPLLERWKGKLSELFRIFGSVPLFAYVLHIYIAHALAIIVNAAMGNPLQGFFNHISNAIFRSQLFEGTGVSLPYVYLAWIAVVAILYPLCRWWSEVRARSRKWWMSYL